MLFFLLINVKMPTTGQEKSQAQLSRAEHEFFYNLGPWLSLLVAVSPVNNSDSQLLWQRVIDIHVINFKEASGRFFFHFLEVFKKCIGYIRIFFIHFLEVSKCW